MTCPTCSGELRFAGAYASRCPETGYCDEGDRYVCTGCGDEFTGEELDEMASNEMCSPSPGAESATAPIFQGVA